jgi:hypothetical protein
MNIIENAVKRLLKEAEASHYRQQLTEMWESYITNPLTNNTTEIERMEKLYTWKNLCEFLKQIE